MARMNTSSVDTTKAERLAHFSTQQKAEIKSSFTTNGKDVVEEQVVNARKAVSLAKKKAKAKARAKMAKASKKKNKKR